jgi:hypothetical protein
MSAAHPDALRPAADDEPPLRWWQTRWFMIAAVLGATIPLLWPAIPPLTDLPGHIGRYRVELAIGSDPRLREWYDFRWMLIPNLGIDLLVVPLAKLFGLELAVKLIVTTIPALTVAGLLWIAREVHGRIPATALFALPLAYGYPLQFGFVNFGLSMALALLACGFWLRLGRLDRTRSRAAGFVAVSCLIWLCHAYGWGLLGILVFSVEVAHARGRSAGWAASVGRAILACLSLCLPVLLMIVWRGDGAEGGTGDWFHWSVKLLWLMSVLRDRWQGFDLLSAAIPFAVIIVALPSARRRFAPGPGLAALLLAIAFVLLPRILFGSAYADMRLAPYALAVALVALRPIEDSGRAAGLVAGAALAFCLARLAGNTASLAMYDVRYRQELAALDHVPVGARMVSFVGYPCMPTWTTSRLLHLPAIALERRRAFSNDQWAMAGAQLLGTRYAAAGAFQTDPSELVVGDDCPPTFWRPVSQALATFPRGAFDYVWLIDPPSYRADATRDLVPIWRSGSSVLFRVERLSTNP